MTHAAGACRVIGAVRVIANEVFNLRVTLETDRVFGFPAAKRVSAG